MKIYEIYSLIRTRRQGKKEKKETEYYDGPYYCPETAKEELEELNKEKNQPGTSQKIEPPYTHPFKSIKEKQMTSKKTNICKMNGKWNTPK